MKRFIILAALGWYCVVNLMAQLNENKSLPWDSIPPLLPPFEMKPVDTLRFNPGDTIPYPIWEKFLRKNEATTGRTIEAPMDKMPVIVPPDHNFYMIVTKPDTTFHFYMRNLHGKSGKRPSPKQFVLPEKIIKQNR
ncbi:MAG: hypothetical protein GX042_09135 [Bacteroidales bacterium]|jgi:hypothetical protein|nr:hypothetical protein [Bacteroidales bacterium]